MLTALRADPLTVRLQVRLAVAGLPWPEVVAYLAALAATGELDAESLLTAAQALESSGLRTIAPDETTSLATLEHTLAASPDAPLRRLALAALLAQATQPAGWTAALRARLAHYRADLAPLVAAAAQFVFPPLAEEAAAGPA